MAADVHSDSKAHGGGCGGFFTKMFNLGNSFYLLDWLSFHGTTTKLWKKYTNLTLFFYFYLYFTILLIIKYHI